MTAVRMVAEDEVFDLPVRPEAAFEPIRSTAGSPVPCIAMASGAGAEIGMELVVHVGLEIGWVVGMEFWRWSLPSSCVVATVVLLLLAFGDLGGVGRVR